MANRVALWWKEAVLAGTTPTGITGAGSDLHAWWIQNGYTTNMDSITTPFDPPGGNAAYGGQFVIGGTTTVGNTRRISINDLPSTPAAGLTVGTLALMRSGTASSTTNRRPFVYYDTLAGLPIALTGQTILITWDSTPAVIM